MRWMLRAIGIGYLARKGFYWLGRLNNYLADGDAWGGQGKACGAKGKTWGRG